MNHATETGYRPALVLLDAPELAARLDERGRALLPLLLARLPRWAGHAEGVAAFLTALLGVRVEAFRHETVLRPLPAGRESRLGGTTLGSTWHLGTGRLDAAGLRVVVGEGRAEPAGNLAARGWVRVVPGGIEPGELLRLAAEYVIPAGIPVRWEFRLADEQPDAGWVLGRSRLGSTRLATTPAS